MNKLFKKIATLAFGAVMAIGVGAGLIGSREATPVHAATEQWTLVTDASALTIDSQVIIAAKNASVALSTTQNNNNRGQAAVTKSGSTLTYSSSVQVFTLKAGTTSGTFAFYTGSGYIYAASSSSNHLKTQTNNNANGSWNISVASSGVATVKASGTNTRNWLRHNSQSSLFSCYSSGQNDIALYVKTLIDDNAPKLDSLEITGDLGTKTYDVFDSWSQAGLTVNATYDNEETTTMSSGLTWTFDPATPKDYFLNQSTSLNVTAASGSVVSKPATIEGIQVNATYTDLDKVASLTNNTNVVVRGIVKSIDTAWNSSFKNLCATIIDEKLNTLYLYRLGTQVVVGDDITVIGQKSVYNSVVQINQGGVALIHSSGNTIPGGEEVAVEMTIAEALEAEVNTLAIVDGIVKTIDTEWDATAANMSVTIIDENLDTLYLYRLGTKVAVGDDITVTGKISYYNSKNQIANGLAVINSSNNEIPGATQPEEPEEPETPVEPENPTAGQTVTINGTDLATIPANAAENVTATAKSVTFTISNGLRSGDEVRCYKGQILTITSVRPISEINFTCTANGTTKYGPGCFTLHTDSTGTYTYEDAIGTWAGNATTVALTATENQVRFTKVTVTFAENELDTFAQLLLDQTSTICANGTYDNADALEGTWDAVIDAHEEISKAYSDAFNAAEADQYSDDVLEQAAARYDYLVGKYSNLTRFAARSVISLGSSFIAIINKVDYTALIVITVIAVLGVAALVVIRRRRTVSR